MGVKLLGSHSLKQLLPVPQSEVPFQAFTLCATLIFILLATLSSVTEPRVDDELFSWSMARLPPTEMIRATAKDVHPPLSYFLMWLWGRAFPSFGAMRAFTIGFGLGALFLAGNLARRLYGKEAAVLAVLLFAALPQITFLSAFARMYSLALLLEFAAVLGWLVSEKRPRVGWCVFTVSLAGLLYTQNLGHFFSIALLAWCAFQIALSKKRVPTVGTRSWTWLISAALAIALLYAPWVPVLRMQSGHKGILKGFDSPTFVGFFEDIFGAAYLLSPGAPIGITGWLCGIALFIAIPLIGLIVLREGPIGEDGPGARERYLPLWLGWGPLVAILLVSILILPVFTARRHGVMFIPFLLVGISGVLARWASNPKMRFLIVSCLAAFPFWTFSRLHKPHHIDVRNLIDIVQERSPLSAPIVEYPGYFAGLMSSLPLLDGPNVPVELPECTLIVENRNDNRSHILDVMDKVRVVASQAKSVEKFYESYDFAAYHFRGLPPGTIRNLVAHPPEAGEGYSARFGGGWKVESEWSGEKLLDVTHPKAEIVSAEGLPAKIRLRKSPALMHLPQGDAEHGAYRAAIVACKLQTQGGVPDLRISTLWGSQPWPLRVEVGEFACAAWIPPGHSTSKIEFQIPIELTHEKFAAKGDDPAGLYLRWIGEGLVQRSFFEKPGVRGLFLDVGAVSDLFFLRDGFHEREGVPPNDYRWTRETFSVEIPIWEDLPCTRVLLAGRLPEMVKDRTVKLAILVFNGESKSPIQTIMVSTEIQPSEYGHFEIVLPESLKPGIARLEFSLGGTWSPKEAGLGGDPRRLGFFLDSLALE